MRTPSRAGRGQVGLGGRLPTVRRVCAVTPPSVPEDSGCQAALRKLAVPGFSALSPSPRLAQPGLYIYMHYSGIFAGFPIAPEFSRFAGLSLHRNIKIGLFTAPTRRTTISYAEHKGVGTSPGRLIPANLPLTLDPT